MNRALLFVWRSTDDSYLVSGGHSVEPPAIDVPSLTRIAPLAHRWCQAQQLRASWVTTIGGIGRADGAIHWGAWLRLDGPADGHSAVPLETIESGTRDPVTRRLASALRVTRRCASHSSWIGFNPYWPEVVQAWIARQHLGRHVGPVVAIRADGTSIVASSTVDGRAIFFTTRSHSFDDPELCDVLEAHAPGLVPRTLAYDPARRWWLTADIEGCDSKTYIEREEGVAERLARIMTAIARAQVATVGSRDIQRLSFNVSLPSVRDGVERAIRESGDEADLRSSIDGLWAAAHANDAPVAWVHSDPSPDNIRVGHNERLLCIDMEDPWAGPAPLMGALTLHSMSHRCGWTMQQSQAIGDIAWNRYVRDCGLTPERHGFADWLRLALLVRLIRRVDGSARGPGRLLHEETPRRARAIASELHRLCAGL
jgi:hypothetical protein